jgi:predicted Zn finger-like uncharacterized protein
VIVRCPNCQARYQYDEQRFGDSETKRLKCSKCSTVFEVVRPRGASGDDAGKNGASPRSMEETTHSSELKRTFSEEERALPDLAPLSSSRRYSLAVIMGANAGQILPITQPRVVLGRGVNTEVQLQDSEVSRRHAMLEIREDQATLTDLGSTNGTFVDGVRVQRAQLTPHQEFSLGATTLMFIVTELHDPGNV